MTESIAELAKLLHEHAREEGRLPTALAGVELFRSDRPTPIDWILYNASVIFVAQGAKRARLGNERFEYKAGDYLILPVSLPLYSTIVEASREKPFLAVSVFVNPRAVAQTLVELGDSGPTDQQRSVAIAAMTQEMIEATSRLIRTLDSEGDRNVLAPLITQELLYWVLKGPQGGLLRAAAETSGRLSQVGRALDVIHREYAKPLRVPQLARAAFMAESTFYNAFRSVTAMTPLQYLREVRLNRARQLLEFEDLGVGQTAMRVGYNSRSQFSREFKTRFGHNPSVHRARPAVT